MDLTDEILLERRRFLRQNGDQCPKLRLRISYINLIFSGRVFSSGDHAPDRQVLDNHNQCLPLETGGQPSRPCRHRQNGVLQRLGQSAGPVLSGFQLFGLDKCEDDGETVYRNRLDWQLDVSRRVQQNRHRSPVCRGQSDTPDKRGFVAKPIQLHIFRKTHHFKSVYGIFYHVQSGVCGEDRTPRKP